LRARAQVSVATVGQDKAVSVWDLRRPGQQPALRIADAHRGESTAVCWRPGSGGGAGGLASGGADAAVRLWDPRAPAAPLAEGRGHVGGVSGVAFAPGGGELASTGADGCLIQWRLG
jgi:WD40 repeat protein